jgi:hypothetical protein
MSRTATLESPRLPVRPIISTKWEVGFGVRYNLGLEVGFLSFAHNPTPILPNTEAVEIMFSS